MIEKKTLNFINRSDLFDTISTVVWKRYGSKNLAIFSFPMPMKSVSVFRSLRYLGLEKHLRNVEFSFVGGVITYSRLLSTLALIAKRFNKV